MQIDDIKYYIYYHLHCTRNDVGKDCWSHNVSSFPNIYIYFWPLNSMLLITKASASLFFHPLNRASQLFMLYDTGARQNSHQTLQLKPVAVKKSTSKWQGGRRSLSLEPSSQQILQHVQVSQSAKSKPASSHVASSTASSSNSFCMMER